MKILSEAKKLKKIEKEADIQFAKNIKIRDNFCCTICGKKENLNTHHIFPRERQDLRHEEMNAITLCILHHKFSLEISPHKNAFEFFCWLERNRPEQFKFLKSNCMEKIIFYGT